MKRNDPDRPQSALDAKTRKRIRITIIVMMIVLTVLSFVYLNFVWNRYLTAAKSEAIVLAESVESLLHVEHIFSMTGTEADVGSDNYEMTKRSLLQLFNPTTRYALHTCLPNEATV